MAGLSGVFCSGSSGTGRFCHGFGDLVGPNPSAADSRAAPRAESGHSFALGPCDGQRCEPVSRAGPFSRKPGSPVAARKGRCRGCREWYGAVHGPDGPIPGGEGSPKSPRGWSPAGRRAAPCARTSGGRGRRGCGTNVRPRAAPPPPGPAGRPRSGRHGAHRAADGER